MILKYPDEAAAFPGGFPEWPAQKQHEQPVVHIVDKYYNIIYIQLYIVMLLVIFVRIIYINIIYWDIRFE